MAHRLGGLQHAVLASLALSCSAATASGLQVSPISLQLDAHATANGIWLSNSGDAPLDAQVRVLHWTQTGGEDQLEPSRGLIISPPMLVLAPGERQLVRVIRAGATRSAHEDAYRILIDELPVAAHADTAGRSAGTGTQALQFVLRYSVPVFLVPSGVAASTPQLQGRVVRDNGQSVLEIENTGTMHAQLGNLVHVDDRGRRSDLVAGLLGYVLAGQTMRWPLDDTNNRLAGGHLLSRINGEPGEQTVAAVPTSP